MIPGIGLPFLDEIVLIFLVSVLIAYICYRLKLVSIVGFLIAGVIIGPNALGLVQEQELVDILAEIGVILLLFTIGIEFSLEKLNRIRKAIFVGGGLQVVLTVSAVAVILIAFGISWRVGIYTGCLVALSSTAVILGLLSQEGETDTPAGQLSLAVLIFQDLAIIIMVLLIPVLAGQTGTGIYLLLVLGKSLLLIALVIILASRIVPWILKKVAQTRRQELFLLTVIAICFGTAALTNMAGVSLALGAFLAGLVVSESHFSDHALSEILPLRTIFNAVFFVSVGMLLNINYIFEYPLLLLGSLAAVVLIKATLTTGSLVSLGYSVRIAAASGLTLAQIGEFSFVLERAGRIAGLSPGGMGDLGSQTFIAVSVILMILTPFLMKTGPDLGELLVKTPLNRIGQKSVILGGDNAPDLEDHVIIIGYGPAGRRLVQVLRDTGIPFVVIEMNPDSVSEMQGQGIQVIYGDATQRHILELACIQKAKLCVIAINDPSASPRIIKLAHFLNPTLQIIVRTRYLSDVEHLEQAGADIVVPEELETTVRIFSHVLGAYMISPDEIEEHIRILRAHDYKILRGSIQEAHLMVLQGLDEEGLHTRAVAVREGSHAAGKTLKELEFRNKYQLTVLAVRRNTHTIGNPDGNFKILPGDRLVLVGTAERFTRCADLFRES